MKPLMCNAKRQRMFHRTADAPRFYNRLKNPYIALLEQRLARRLASFCPEAGRVLEVGCGEGSNLDYLLEERQTMAMVGVDFSGAKVALAAQELSGPTFVCADAQALPFPAGAFDCVFCRDLLHHVDFNRSGVLAEMLRVLKPKGTVVVFESRGATLLNSLFMLLYPVERGLAHSSPSSLLALAQGRGEVRLEFMEASMLTRALGFVLGWQCDAFYTPLLRVLYTAAHLVESIWEKLLPRRWWAYMCLIIVPSASNPEKA